MSTTPPTFDTPEHQRLQEARTGEVLWKAWGPYLSERQWGTVREDYSGSGDAWDYFTHDQARSRAYHWGEDGIAGICDERQRLCLALALWNGADPILKERMFGLANSEGNHGEDVKEYWFYLDSTPTHSYMKCQYKYPQGAFPYLDLAQTNRSRSKQEMEYELLDTGIFDEDRYFDVIVEYAKAAADDIVMLVTAHNRGPDAATLHLLPTLWFRNTWSWGGEVPKPTLKAVDGEAGVAAASASHPELGDWVLRADGSAQLLFCENETNNRRLFGGENASLYVKDGINDFVVAGVSEAVNPERTGTKVAAHHVLEIAAGDSATVRLRLTKTDDSGNETKKRGQPLGASFDKVLSSRLSEADQFYATLIPSALTEDEAMVMRQALAGLLWGKQYYEYDVHRWLGEHGVNPWDPNVSGTSVRNAPWFHMVAQDVISMPDKWEYPWFAAWDLAFHCVPISLVDVDFAKEQIELLLRTRYQHPNGQIPAYEWNFSDVNPPVTPWAALWVYEREAEIRGEGDREFLARVFNRLVANFTWWVNRKDPDDRNLFQGGFLGLDNIGIFDRSAPMPGGGQLEQADGTAWMALYAQCMLQIAAELARHDPVYLDMAFKFIGHFVWIAVAMNPPEGGTALWDEQDGFYYDVMRMPDGQTIPLKVRSLVGLLPMCAATVFDGDLIEKLPRVAGADHGVRRALLRCAAAVGAAPRAQPRGTAHGIARRRGAAAEDPRDHARRGRVPRPVRDPRDLPPAPRQSGRVRLGRPALRGPLSPGRVRHRHVRRQLQLARPGLVPDEPGDHAWPVAAVPLLRRPAEGRVPDGLRPADEPARGGQRDQQAPHGDIPQRRERTPARVRRDREVPDRSALARPDPVPRVLPRRQRRRHRRESPDRLDRIGGAVVRARRDVQGAAGRDRRRCRLICRQRACLTVPPPARSHPAGWSVSVGSPTSRSA